VAVVLIVTASGGVAASAAADAPRRLSLDTIAEIEPGSSELYGLALDEGVQRAFVLDVGGRMVRAYDTSSGSLVPAGSVVVGTTAGRPRGLAVNTQTHQVFVIDDSSGSDVLVVIDGDPASPTSGGVIARLPTGGSRGYGVAVDPVSNHVIVSNATAPHVSIVDLTDGSVSALDTGAVPHGMAADPRTGYVYVSSFDDQSLTVVRPDGSWTKSPLPGQPTEVEVAGDQLIVAFACCSGNQVASLDLVSLVVTAVSRPLGAAVSDLTVDEARHAIFVGHNSVGAPAMEVLRTGSLVWESAAPDGFSFSLAVDSVSHRLVGVENGLSSKVSLLEPHLSPLPSASRIGGADRFDVAAEVSRTTFSSGVPVAYVASGGVFADALSGAAAAGAQGGPVLLVTRDSVPPATVDELKRLRPRRIVVLGGTATVSPGVESALGSFGRVSRIAGGDRYALSAAVSAAAFPDGAGVAYLASGEVYSDALSASPLTGQEKGPVLLTPRGALPSSVAAEIVRLKAQYVYVLGGESTVSPAVVAEVEKSAAVIRIDGADRFAVSAAASSRMFRPGTYTVYVASGEVFPDALAGAPAAISEGAPVLLLRKDEIPTVIATELERLRPYRIVVLGGPRTLSERVLEQVQTYLPD
jgi:putative cell wall-binding protein/DNA-binding beta-propeller fold protein YncE